MSLFTNTSTSSTLDARVKDHYIDGFSYKQVADGSLVKGGILFGKVYGIFAANQNIVNGSNPLLLLDDASLLVNTGGYYNRATGEFTVPAGATLCVQCRFNITKAGGNGAVSIGLIDAGNVLYTVNATPVIVNGDTLTGALFDLTYVNTTNASVVVIIQVSCPAGTADIVGNNGRVNNFIIAQLYT